MADPARQHAPTQDQESDDQRQASAGVDDEQVGGADRAVATANSHAAITAEVDADRPAAPTRDEESEPAPVVDKAPSVDDDASDEADGAAVESKGKTIVLGGGGYVVLAGDTLKKISAHEYGHRKHWRKIKAANRARVHSGNRIHEGDVLMIPEMEVDTLQALKSFQDQPARLRDLVSLMPAEEYEGFMAGLSHGEIEKNGHLLQLAEINRSTGMTIAELGAEQRSFLDEQAEATGGNVSANVAGVVATNGYGGGEAKGWNSFGAPLKSRWKRRFHAVVRQVKDNAPPDVKRVIKDAERKGGGFRWSPKEVEENDAFAYTYSGSWELHCGTRWVDAAENDPASVHGNIAHEMGGHNYYGETFGDEIIEAALTDDEEKKAEESGNSLHSAYGYMETEIFAELYEYPHVFPDDPTTARQEYPSDSAFDTDTKGRDVTGGDFEEQGDVIYQLKRIRDAFAPKVASGLVSGLSRRVELDPRIIPEAKERFRKAVLYVFVAPP